MSDHAHTAPGEQAEEVDNLPNRGVIIVIAATTFATVALIGVGWAALELFKNEFRPPDVAPWNQKEGQFPERNLPAPHRAANIRAHLFNTEKERPRLAESQRAHLDSYDWVDKEKRTVHVPVEKVYELVIEQAANGAGGAGPKSGKHSKHDGAKDE